MLIRWLFPSRGNRLEAQQQGQRVTFHFNVIQYHQDPFRLDTVHHFTCCRKEVKDPDVLYNMLKNLLAQIKVSVSAEHSGSAGEAEVKNQCSPSEPSRCLALHGTCEKIRGSRLLRDHPLSYRSVRTVASKNGRWFPSGWTSALKFISASLSFVWTLIFSSDLKTMTERLKNRYYVTKKLFIADLQRIISNCREYNHPDSEYCKCANTLEKFFYFKLKDGGLIEKWTCKRSVKEDGGKSQGRWWGSSHQRVFTHFTCWTWTNSRECWETTSSQWRQRVTSPIKCTKATAPGQNSVGTSKNPIGLRHVRSGFFIPVCSAASRTTDLGSQSRVAFHCWRTLEHPGIFTGFPKPFKHLAIKANIGALRWLTSAWKPAESGCWYKNIPLPSSKSSQQHVICTVKMLHSAAPHLTCRVWFQSTH